MKLAFVTVLVTLLRIVTSTPVLSVDIHITENAVVASHPEDASRQLQHALVSDPTEHSGHRTANTEEWSGFVELDGEDFSASTYARRTPAKKFSGILYDSPLKEKVGIYDVRFIAESWDEFDGPFAVTIYKDIAIVEFETGALIVKYGNFYGEDNKVHFEGKVGDRYDFS